MAQAIRRHAVAILRAATERRTRVDKAIADDLDSSRNRTEGATVSAVRQITISSILEAIVCGIKTSVPSFTPNAPPSAEDDLDFSRNCTKGATVPAARKATIRSILEAIICGIKTGVPSFTSITPPSAGELVLLYQLFDLFSDCETRQEAVVDCDACLKDTSSDIAQDPAQNKRFPAVSPDAETLQTTTNSPSNSSRTSTSDMAGRFPVLSTSNLPQATPEEQSATASPARGTAMLNSIFKSVRVPEFRHKWMFWAEKGQQATPKDKSAQSEEYASRPKPLGDQIISVKEFYQHFNNIPVESLKLRDSIHLFHLGVKPVWEDPRNTRGGAWYFKIPKDIAAQFWHEMCLLAVGDGLQGAVETKRACKLLS
jgi:hypothetical protein